MPKAAVVETGPKDLATTKLRRPRSKALDCTPSLQEAEKRLRVASTRSQPWLDPAGLEAAKGKAELVGPATYRKR